MRMPPRSSLACSAAASGRMEMLRLTLELGADINTPDIYNRRTALHEAAAAGNHAMVQVLLGAKANVNLKDKDGRTAADLAREAGEDDLADLLKPR